MCCREVTHLQHLCISSVGYADYMVKEGTKQEPANVRKGHGPNPKADLETRNDEQAHHRIRKESDDVSCSESQKI